MASINGVTVKNVTWFRGSEGDAAQGNLYIVSAQQQAI